MSGSGLWRGLIRRLHETGVPASEDELPIPQPPEAPPFNVGSIVQGFMVRLPEGRYIVQMEGPDGLPVPHSSKELVVFSHDREGVGFIIRPEDRWTRHPGRSHERSKAIDLSAG